MEKVNNCSLNLEQKNIKKLKELFPENVQGRKVGFQNTKTFVRSETPRGGARALPIYLEW